MLYQEILKKAKKAPILRLEDIKPRLGLKPYEFVQLHHWLKNGRLIRLKRGLYTLPKGERRSSLSPLWLANQLYWPSYISLEYSLGSYGIIPEAIGPITSVTTLKTNAFKNAFGAFTYRKINSSYFFGFKTYTSQTGQSYWMAEPEKALLDFLYLTLPRGVEINANLLLNSCRLQHLEQLRIGVLRQYLTRFQNLRIQKAGFVLLEIISKKKRGGHRHAR